tara:strand:- start:26 stop:223 length:198 start_codon:yes stop_codon:yes gene_type:complete
VHVSLRHAQSTPEPVHVSARHGFFLRMRGTQMRTLLFPAVIASLNLQNIQEGSYATVTFRRHKLH